MTATLLLAVTAGMLTAVNPCGFAMLPAYLSVLVAGDRPAVGAAAGRRPVARALTCSLALTLGYVAVFGAFGLAVVPASRWVQPQLPWVTVGLGLLLLAAGGWLLAGRSLPGPARAARAPRLTGSVPSMVLFGMGYAVASLGCAVGPFLAIVASSLRAGSAAQGVLLFVAYAAGMALVVTVTAVAVALLRASVVARLRRVGALVPRLGGVVLALAGGYVAYYGAYELRLAADARAASADPVIGVAVGLQQRVAEAVGQLGAASLVGVLLVLVAAGWVLGRLRARTGDPVPGD